MGYCPAKQLQVGTGIALVESMNSSTERVDIPAAQHRKGVHPTGGDRTVVTLARRRAPDPNRLHLNTPQSGTDRNGVVRCCRWTVVVTDLYTPTIDSLDLVRYIEERSPQTRAILTAPPRMTGPTRASALHSSTMFSSISQDAAIARLSPGIGRHDLANPCVRPDAPGLPSTVPSPPPRVTFAL